MKDPFKTNKQSKTHVLAGASSDPLGGDGVYIMKHFLLMSVALWKATSKGPLPLQQQLLQAQRTRQPVTIYPLPTQFLLSNSATLSFCFVGGRWWWSSKEEMANSGCFLLWRSRSWRHQENGGKWTPAYVSENLSCALRCETLGQSNQKAWEIGANFTLLCIWTKFFSV